MDTQSKKLLVTYTLLIFAQMALFSYFMWESITAPSNITGIPFGILGAIIGINALRSGTWLLPILERIFYGEEITYISQRDK